jgi:hypothetical protein
MNYIGMPIDKKRPRKSQWGPVYERFAHKLSRWKGKMLSMGDKLTLVNACLCSIPLYMMSFLEVPKGVLKKWDMYRKKDDLV